VPGAVGALQARQPLEGPLGLGVAPTEREGHGRLDVVPRVGVAAGEPGDHARRQLPLGDGVDGRLDVGRVDDAGDVAETHVSAGFRA
jgi:hypothetical protein